jgi:mono/diheme cytochrome c family protein
VAFAFVALAAIGWTGLTAAALATKPPQTAAARIDYSGPTDWMQLSPEELAGVAYFRSENCGSCHTAGQGGTGVGPDLAQGSIHHKDAAWMINHFKRPSVVRPGTSMPPIQLSDAQLNALASFLLKLNPGNASALQDAPEVVARGAQIYQANQCGMCHMVNGAGASMGPALNGLSKRRAQSWVTQHFANPEKLSPGSIMPPYSLPPRDMDALIEYLFSLPDPSQ